MVNLYLALLIAVNVVLEKENTELEPDWFDHVFTFTQEEPVYLSIFIVPFLYFVPLFPTTLITAEIFPALVKDNLQVLEITFSQQSAI